MDITKIQNAPKSPGCYMFHDRLGNIIYVGKSRDLSKRVRQYFQREFEPDNKLYTLAREAVDVEYRITESELDALILEYTLIKRHKPWFNAQLKNDEPRPYLKLERSGTYPALYPVYERAEDGARYYAGFRDEYAVSDALSLIQSVWKTPSCMNRSFERRRRPCLNRHIGKCMAPCTGRADSERYIQAVAEIERFLDGMNTVTPRKIEREMRVAAKALEFEYAAECKQTLEALHALQRRCRNYGAIEADANCAVLLAAYRSPEISLFIVVGGKVVSRLDMPDEAAVRSALDAAYDSRSEVDAGDVVTDQTAPEYSTACLSEILVRRLVVPLPDKVDAALSKVMRAISEFRR